jgi:Tfp pilus assembly protein PilW
MVAPQIGFRLSPGGYDAGLSARLRSGYTLIELLIAATITVAFLATGAALLKAGSNAYDDLVWQPRVDQEAQQALDDICDTLRLSGDEHDLLVQVRSTGPQQVYIPMNGESTASTLDFTNQYGAAIIYQVQQSPSTGLPYLTRQYGNNVNSVATYVVTVNFEYEYRKVAQIKDAAWEFSRLSDLASWNGTTTNPVYLIDMVYITVTAQVTPYPDGPQYQRTLRSAVHLRAPFNSLLPPAVAGQ